MADIKLVVETIQSLDQLIGALDTLVDSQFARGCQIEFTNGEIDPQGHQTKPGVPYFFCAFKNVKRDDQAPFLQVTEGNGDTVDLVPPEYDELVKPGDGFVVGNGSKGGYGANLMVPIVLAPLWLDAPASMKVSSTVAVPPAVASKFTNPMPYYVWIVIGGIYGPPTGLGGPGANNGPAMSAISYAIWPEDYPTNAPTPKSVQTMLDTAWTEVNNNWSRGTHDADEIGPDSAFIKILGDASA
jgi:hypothetical protein